LVENVFSGKSVLKLVKNFSDILIVSGDFYLSLFRGESRGTPNSCVGDKTVIIF